MCKRTRVRGWEEFVWRMLHKVKISDITECDSEINVEGEVTEKSYAREVHSKYGRVLMVVDATLKD